MWEFLLYLLSAVSLGLAAVQVQAARVSLMALGLLFFVLVPLIHAAQGL
jgi:hypothetical protein